MLALTQALDGLRIGGITRQVKTAQAANRYDLAVLY
jgi:hypothetical protein